MYLRTSIDKPILWLESLGLKFIDPSERFGMTQTVPYCMWSKTSCLIGLTTHHWFDNPGTGLFEPFGEFFADLYGLGLGLVKTDPDPVPLRIIHDEFSNIGVVPRRPYGLCEVQGLGSL
jgi:hypothetical protein